MPTMMVDDRLQLLEDRLAINDLAARFSDCVNERDFDGFAACWSDTGIWEIGPPLESRAQGVTEIIAMLRRLLEPDVLFMQMTHSGVVTMTGDTASGRFCERERGKTRDNRYYENLAVYHDKFVRGPGGVWQFSHRHYEYRYLDDTYFPGQVFRIAPPSERVDKVAVAEH